VVPPSALSSLGPIAIAAKPPDSLQPSLLHPQGLSTKLDSRLIHSLYDDTPSTMVIDMEATLSPIRKYYQSVQGSAMPLQSQSATASTQEHTASTETFKGEEFVPPPNP
jgi:hypothetical protein